MLVEPVPLRRPGLADATRRSATTAGLAPGRPIRSRDAIPATWGAAIEVPEMVLVAVEDVCHADLMPLPGANRSTQDPRFEKLETESELVVDPTVMAFGAEAGERVQALVLSLPAATTMVTPSSIARWTATFTVEFCGPPRLMLATAGSPAAWSEITQSIPAMIPDQEP